MNLLALLTYLIANISLAQVDSKLVCKGTDCTRKTVIRNITEPKLTFNDYLVDSCYVRFEAGGKLTYMKIESKSEAQSTLNFIIALEDTVLERKKYVEYETTKKYTIRKIPCSEANHPILSDDKLYGDCLKTNQKTYKLFCIVPRKKADNSNF